MIILLLLSGWFSAGYAMQPATPTSTFFAAALSAQNKEAADALYHALPANQQGGAKRKFKDKFTVEPSAPAAALPADMPESIKEKIKAKEFADAFVEIIDGVGKQVVEKLKVGHKDKVQAAIKSLAQVAA